MATDKDTVLVKRPKRDSDGNISGWEEKEVSAELAKKQLSIKDKSKRNPAWRNVEYADSKTTKSSDK